jgi:DNA-binding FadR family transcriptional regulator
MSMESDAGTPKLAQRIAEAIERDILTSERPVGESLGTEAELMARYGVGRPVLREALVLVARDGLAEMRRGKIGGLIVTAPTEGHVAASLQNYLDLVVADFHELLRIRRELEDRALLLAIERFAPEDIPLFERLQAEFEAADDQRSKLAVGRAMLHAIATAARNPFLSVLVMAFSNLSTQRFARHTAQASALLAQAEAIARLRSEQLAAVLGAAHGRALVASDEIFAIFDRMSQARESRRPVEPEADAPFAEDGVKASKLAGKIAHSLKEQIVSERLSAGAHLGAEPELMMRYGVSRGVLREAVRILENLSVARMVRGKGGGLRVLTPTPHSVVRSACVFLRANVNPRNLQEIGEGIGRLAAEMAAVNAAHRDPERVRAQIRGLAELEGSTLRQLAFAHYNILGDLSGSRAIGMIVSILANLYALDESDSADQVIVREIVPQRLRDLIDAIGSGRPDLSRRRMALLQRSGARVRLRPLASFGDPELLEVLTAPGT